MTTHSGAPKREIEATPISEVATTAIDHDTAGRPRWEEKGVTDGHTGLTDSAGSWRWRRLLVGRDNSATTTTSGGSSVGQRSKRTGRGRRRWRWLGSEDDHDNDALAGELGEEHRAPGTYDNSDD
ncbi:hypothetical protein E2562_035958 [Oryza meyeriana var. granulata]|uniref:DUF834 domain-containing protein n=1 Tax=Oryza meyeriana var. granulata TaxID=110450 RepID=A0A6G1F1R4_9ORYZ|nr:hypothetical protein E2562_035958 [Oryza meyeriana var. granulata]